MKIFSQLCKDKSLINTLKKYLFGLVVISYIITVIGVPVYLHYCGGQLEKINYIVKTSSCCDGEDEESPANDCCEDEGAYVQNHTDFTLKLVSFFSNHLTQVFTTELFFSHDFALNEYTPVFLNKKPAPPDLYSESIISTSVLRI